MKNNKTVIPISCIVVLLCFAIVLAIPSSREVFKTLSNTHPYIMGFIKFGLLATVGELLAIKLSTKEWKWPVCMVHRVVIWGLIGVAITYMMKCYTGGIIYLMGAGLLPGGALLASGTFLGTLLKAFFISTTMNLTFGPTFMAFHKCSDKWLEFKAAGEKDTSIQHIVKDVNWGMFVSFTLFKTVPFFWIPAHTVTFILPAEYQVMVAATLSIALGIILSLKK